MSNEIILREPAEIGNNVLKRVTAKAITLLNAGIKSEKDVALAVHSVDEKELAVKSGFKSTADWASQYLKWDKSKTSRYIKIVREFSDFTMKDGSKAWDIFSATQLVEMLKAKRVEDLDKITPDMTCKEIRTLLSREFIDEPETEQGEPETEQDEPETEQSEPEQDETPVIETNIKKFDVVGEYKDITVAMSVIKEHMLHNNLPLIIVRTGDVWQVGALHV